MSAVRPQRHVLLPALRRFWALVLLAGLVAGVTASWSVRTTASTTYSAQATYVVPLRPPVQTAADGSTVVVDPQLPTSPSDAARYAQAYAVLLREDPALLGALASATGQTVAEVRGDINVVPVPDSAVLRIDFASDSEAEVTAFFAALETTLGAVPAVSPNVPSGNLRLLGAPEPQVDRGLRPLADLIGVLVGIAVGLGAAVTLERIDPRVRSSADVRELATWPVVEVGDDETDARSEVLVQRVIAAYPDVRTVAVVGVPGMPLWQLTELAHQLDRTTTYLGIDVPAGQNEPGLGRRAVEWVVAGRLARDGAAERRAQLSDVVVLAVPRRASLVHLTAAVESLQDVVTDQHVVAALVPVARRRRGPSDAGVLPAVEAKTGEVGVYEELGGTAPRSEGAPQRVLDSR